MKKNLKGFTLIEVLLVVALVAILAGIVILAINPGKQIADTRDTQRSVDVNTIINAAYQYIIDGGDVNDFTNISTSAQFICLPGTTCPVTTVDLGVLINNEQYLVNIPQDPTDATSSDVGYQISLTANDRLIVTAPHAENTSISITR